MEQERLCTGCGAQIGVHEPVVTVEGGWVRVTAAAAEARLWDGTGARYHAGCYEALTPYMGPCVRCARPAPSFHSQEYVEWEVVVDAGGEVGFACRGCLTDEEAQPWRDALLEPGPPSGADRALSAL
jgi:hypothetical protein